LHRRVKLISVIRGLCGPGNIFAVGRPPVGQSERDATLHKRICRLLAVGGIEWCYARSQRNISHLQRTQLQGNLIARKGYRLLGLGRHCKCQKESAR
jgi:hypothetical protein